jgi:hypothetical protein
LNAICLEPLPSEPTTLTAQPLQCCGQFGTTGPHALSNAIASPCRDHATWLNSRSSAPPTTPAFVVSLRTFPPSPSIT